MQKEELLKLINDIFIDILDDTSIKLKDQTTANEVEGWDSLSHIQIIVAIERKFKIRFGSQEIQKWKNVGEIMVSILSKLP